MLPFRPQLQGVLLPGTGAMVASGLGTEDQVEEVYENGSSPCTIKNDKQEREEVFAETPQRKDPNLCGAGKEGQLEGTPEEH